VRYAYPLELRNCHTWRCGNGVCPPQAVALLDRETFVLCPWPQVRRVRGRLASGDGHASTQARELLQRLNERSLAI
jgi:hypothetical protein